MSDHEEDWSPERDRMPDKLQEKLNKLLDVQLEEIKRHQKQHQEGDRIFLVTPPPPPPTLTLTVQPIKNGYLVLSGRQEGPDAQYYPDRPGVERAVWTLLQAYFAPPGQPFAPGKASPPPPHA